jgi:hypothetical protein
LRTLLDVLHLLVPSAVKTLIQRDIQGAPDPGLRGWLQIIRRQRIESVLSCATLCGVLKFSQDHLQLTFDYYAARMAYAKYL